MSLRRVDPRHDHHTLPHPFVGETFGDDDDDDEATRRVEIMIEAIVASARLAREVDDEKNGAKDRSRAWRRGEKKTTLSHRRGLAIQRLVSDTLHGALGEFWSERKRARPKAKCSIGWKN